MFFDQQIVLEQYPASWLVENLFLEGNGVSDDSVSETLATSWAGGDALHLQDLECHLVQVTFQPYRSCAFVNSIGPQIISNHIKLFWFNIPRRRRHLMKSLLDWQSLHDAFNLLAAQVVVSVSIP